MLKLVQAMDAFVRVLVITVFTTGALQMAGIIKSPRSVSAFPQQHRYRPDGLLPLHEVHRPRRQPADDLDHERASFIDNIFDLPATTMKAFDDFMKKARPTFLKLRDMATKKFHEALAFGDMDRGTRKYRRRAEYYNGPRVHHDGSSSRVLLKI